MSNNSACKLEVGSRVQVKCTAGTGMFPHESAILIRGMDQCYESMIDSELVKIEGDVCDDSADRRGLVEASIVRVNCENILVELPRQVISGGRRIWVPISEVLKYGTSFPSGD